MKRIISAVLCVLMLASITVFAVSADEAASNIVGQTASTKDFVVFDFTVDGQTGVGNNSADAGNALWWGKAKRFDTEFISADSCTRLKFVNPGEDQIESYMTACIPATLQFDPTEFKFIKLCYRCNPELVDDETAIPEFYFGMSEYDPDGEEGAAYYKGQWNGDMFVTAYDAYSSDNEWHDLYVDMTDCVFWGDPEYGFVSEIRLDFFNNSDYSGAYLDVKYIAILKTEEDAENFGIDPLGKFAILEAPETTAAEETTVAEVTTAADVATTAAEVTTVAADADVATTVAEAATTVAGSAATKGEEATTAAAKKDSGCGSTIGVVSVISILGMGLISFKKKHN